MKEKITEEVILFVSIAKWVLLATMIGLIVGLSTAGFLLFLKYAINFNEQYRYYFLILPIALFLSAFLIQHLAPEAEGHGTEKVIEAIHQRAGNIPLLVVPIKLVTTVITIAFGGSVGKEGPCAQIGAGLASAFARLFHFNDQDKRKLVICGVSAGFAAVFGTPIAGALFGVEVLFVGALLYDVLLPSFIAGIISYHVSSQLGITYFYHPIHLFSTINEMYLLEVMGAGIFFGLCSLFFIEVLEWGHHGFKRLNIPVSLKGLLGGCIIILFVFVFSKQYLGLGLNTIEGCLTGHVVHWYAFILKTLMTSITLGAGGSGGVVTAIFFVGSTAGAAFAHLFHLNIAVFSAIGLVSVLAGTANTPIAASVMAIELFGPAIAPYAAVSCIISFLMTGHRSVYPSQILSTSKSNTLKMELGTEMSKVHTLSSTIKNKWLKKLMQQN
ncbi:MAG: voltage-gated chloride channel [Gammaproteobacteria bacterium GWF2_41_13]|nr:MAG: voltage-gated chloride channel [Gammaproteobacteria bacterium GWF2_41_13]